LYTVTRDVLTYVSTGGFANGGGVIAQSVERLGYGLDDRGSGLRFAAGAGNFSLHRRVQNGSGVHPASYLMGTRDSFSGGEAAGA
jgi:hypothetical protein